MKVLQNEAAMKRAPDNFDDEDDNIGDIEENHDHERGRPRDTYQTENSAHKGMSIDQRGAQRKRRSTCKFFILEF